MSPKLRDEWGRRLLPEYVFLETATVLMDRRGIDVAKRFGERLLGSREGELFPASGMFFPAWDVFTVAGKAPLSRESKKEKLAVRRTAGVIRPGGCAPV